MENRNTNTMDFNNVELKKYIKANFINSAYKLKGKWSPFSEIINDKPTIIKISTIFKLKGTFKKFYFLIGKHNLKKLKKRYFLAKLLAYQSSDLLVNLISKFANKYDIKLIQYSLHPETFRVNLLSFKEITSIKGIHESIELLNKLNQEFQTKLQKMRNLLEDE